MSILGGSSHEETISNPIANSLRFNAASSTYLTRTPSTSTNLTTWTVSTWFKRGTLGVLQALFGALTGAGSTTEIGILASDLLYFAWNSTNSITTTAALRDTSAWYHLVVVWDTNNATAADRLRLYINNVRQAVTLGGSYPGTGQSSFWNQNIAHTIGRFNATEYMDGYQTYFCFIDGQALLPTSFGQVGPNGQWCSLSKATLTSLASSGGTNSFFLPFDTGTNTTTLGADASSKANNWTLTNMVRDGSSNDCWSYDTPTKNFATWNPLSKGGGNTTISNGNLKIVKTTSTTQEVSFGSFGIPTDKFYWEIKPIAWSWLAVGMSNGFLGVGGSGSVPINNLWWYYNTNGIQNNAGTTLNSTGYTNNDVLGFAYDGISDTLALYKNNTLVYTVTSLHSAMGLAAGASIFPFIMHDTASNTATVEVNFGQVPVTGGAYDSASGGFFRYTPPAGFKALCTANLPAVSIPQPNKHFDVVTRNGFGGTGGSITSLAFQPDFLWEKNRNAANSNVLVDSIRGTTKTLISDSTSAEGSGGWWSSFNSNGFTTTAGDYGSGVTMVDWLWKAGGAAVTNNAGSITSQVSANATAGFSIVTYTGTGANATVGHGLGVAPKFIIGKSRISGADWWYVYHSALGNTQAVFLQNTNAAQTNAGYWNSTSPTSTVFSLGTASGINTNTQSNVAYCFAEVPGFSKIGSYTGNGSTDGPFVWCGFRPKFVMVKCSSTGGVGFDWIVLDTSRDTYNVAQDQLYPNQSAAEVVNGVADILSNGFKLKIAGGGANTASATMIFLAFAESPFGGSNVLPALAR